MVLPPPGALCVLPCPPLRCWDPAFTSAYPLKSNHSSALLVVLVWRRRRKEEGRKKEGRRKEEAEEGRKGRRRAARYFWRADSCRGIHSHTDKTHTQNHRVALHIRCPPSSPPLHSALPGKGSSQHRMLRMNEKSGDALVELSNTVAGGADQDKLSDPAANPLMQHFAGALMRHVPRLSETLAMQLSSGRQPCPMQLEQLANRMISYEGVPSTDITHNDQVIIGCFAGVDATTWLLAEGFAHNASDALGLSIRLFKARYFMGVDSSVREFLNDDTLYCWNSEMMDSSSDEDDDDDVNSGMEGYLGALAGLTARNSFEEEPYARCTEQQSSQSARVIAEASVAKALSRRTMSTESWNIAVNHQVSVVCGQADGVKGIMSIAAQRKASVISSKDKGGHNRRSKVKLRVRWNLKNNLYQHTYHPADYQRASWFDMDQAMEDWEDEEDDERRRQLEDRWRVFEQRLPRGTKCRERLHYERETAKLASLTRKAQDRARRERVDVTQELLAYLHAADRLYNDLLAGTVSIPGGEPEDPASPDTPASPRTPQSLVSTNNFTHEGDEQQLQHQVVLNGASGATKRPRFSVDSALQADNRSGLSYFAHEQDMAGTAPAFPGTRLAANGDARQSRPQRGRVDTVTRAAKTWDFMLTQGVENSEHRLELQEASALHRSRADGGLDTYRKIEEQMAQRERERRRQLEIERTQQEAAIRQEIERKRRERQRKRSGDSTDFSAQQQQRQQQANAASSEEREQRAVDGKRSSGAGQGGHIGAETMAIDEAKAGAQARSNSTAVNTAPSSSSPAPSLKTGRAPNGKSRPRFLIFSPQRSNNSSETDIDSMDDDNKGSGEDQADDAFCDTGSKGTKQRSSASRFLHKSLRRLSGSSSDGEADTVSPSKKEQKQQRKGPAQLQALATLQEEHGTSLKAEVATSPGGDASEKRSAASPLSTNNSNKNNKSSSSSISVNSSGSSDTSSGSGAGEGRTRSRLADLIRIFERGSGLRSSGRKRSGAQNTTSTSTSSKTTTTPASPHAQGHADPNSSTNSAPSSPRERGSTVSRSFRKLFFIRRGGTPDEGSATRGSSHRSSSPPSPSAPKVAHSTATAFAPSTEAAAASASSPSSSSSSSSSHPPRKDAASTPKTTATSSLGSSDSTANGSKSRAACENGDPEAKHTPTSPQLALATTPAANSPPFVPPHGAVGDSKKRLQDQGARSEKKTKKLSLVPPVVVRRSSGGAGDASGKTGVQAVRAVFEQREQEYPLLNLAAPMRRRTSGSSSSARGSTEAAAASAECTGQERGSGPLVRARKNSYGKMVEAKVLRMGLVTKPGSLGLHTGVSATSRATSTRPDAAAAKKDSSDSSAVSTLRSSSGSAGRGSTDADDQLAQTHDVHPHDSPSKWRRLLSRRKDKDKYQQGPVILPLKDLQTMHHSKLKRRGIDVSAKEQHLSDEEFQRTFGCCKVAFHALPLWRQQQKKKIALLF